MWWIMFISNSGYDSLNFISPMRRPMILWIYVILHDILVELYILVVINVWFVNISDSVLSSQL